MRKYLLTLILLTATLGIHAVVAPDQWTAVTLADGTTIQVLPRGDEFYHYFLTAEGQRLTMGPDGRLVPATAAAQVRGAARRAAANAARMSRRQTAPLSSNNPYIGSKRGLVILVAFKNQAFTKNAVETWSHELNEEGYSKGMAIGSVHDYFFDQSYQQFNVTFDVVGPVTMPYAYAHYGHNDSEGIDDNVGELVRDACLAVDPDVDFTTYDWNDNGQVNMVYILYAGHSESAYSTTNPDLIWPHEWELDYWNLPDGPLYLDGKHINIYACSSELSYGTSISGIGTFCHEFSHALGLPDFYNTAAEDDYVIGSWDVLSSGNYNNYSWCPAGFSAYERAFCGWITPTELVTDCSVLGMQPLSSAAEAYLIRNEAADPNVDEYYLLENRQPEKWDRYLPGSGILVTHVDYDAEAWEYNTPNADPTHYRLSHIVAVGRQGSSTVTFPQNVHNKMRNQLTDNSTPAATLFHANELGTKRMGKPVTNMAVSADGLASFDFHNEISLIKGIHSPLLGERSGMGTASPYPRTSVPTSLLLGRGIELRHHSQTNTIYKQIKTH